MTTEVIAVADGREEAQHEVVVHLDGNIMSMIVCRLPSKAAHGFRAVSKPSRELLSQPAFLRHHLSPRPLPPVDGLPLPVPGMLVVQPKGQHLRPGYVHLAVVSTDQAAANPLELNLPVHAEYQHMARHAPPPAAPAAALQGDLLATFFAQTVPMLDVSIVASDGRLLLARRVHTTTNKQGRLLLHSYYVCFPAANRWIALPPAPVAPPDGATAAGFHYDLVDAESGAISFVVVVVLLAGGLAATFSSETGQWDTKALGVGEHDAAHCLRLITSPGIHAGKSRVYWLSRASAAAAGRVVGFDVARGVVSVLGEPPLVEGFTRRAGRALGSAGGGGRLRLCALDVYDHQPGNDRPHAVKGAHAVWVLDDDAGAWQRVRKLEVHEGMLVSFFKVPFGYEVPFGFAGPSGSSVVVNKNQALLRRDLESGDVVELFDLYTHQYGGGMEELYHDFDVFPLFK